MMRKASQLPCWALGAFALSLLALAAWAQTPGAQDAPIRITVRVPADAKITVDGNLTRQTGPVRYFESPPVPAGRKFYYTLKITWMENGKERSVTKRVPVAAGDNQLDYRSLAGEGAKDKTPPDMKKKGKPKADDGKTDDGKKDDDKKDGEKKDDKNGDKKDDKDKKDADKKDDKDKKDADKNEDKAKKKPDDEAAAPRSREFLFTYAATVTGLKPGQTARVWVPIPPSTNEQRVRMVSQAYPFRRPAGQRA
jgi:uncharacterized protein (TIGR03000 family)